ncbi:hypothetical protein [Bosea sp. (in: a-proteobacteria)]|uniref:hypothetical protein n=1 Tax=Bosea sp. (in: a-proteobacteria) TaxID=1871050 RepID=UPI002FCB450F
MTGIKTSVAVLAVSAVLSVPALAQGVSVDSQTRSNARGAVTAPGASGGANAGVNTQVGVPGAKAGAKGQVDTTGTVGAGGGAAKGAVGAAGKAGVGGKVGAPKQ